MDCIMLHQPSVLVSEAEKIGLGKTVILYNFLQPSVATVQQLKK